MVIAANSGHLFQRLCGRDGAAGAGRRPALRDPHRPRLNEEELDDDHRGVGARARLPSEIDAVLNEAGVVCGPVYTIADIFEDPHFQAREMLVEHDDPELGDFRRPGHRPEAVGHARARCAGRAPGRPGATTSEIYGELLGLPTADLADLSEDGVL